MKAFIQTKHGLPQTTSIFAAYLGFREMGFEIEFFEGFNGWQGIERNDIVVGGLRSAKTRLSELGIQANEIIYPQELETYLHRRVWYSTMDEVSSCVDFWPVFVKSVEGKRVTGTVIRSTKDLVGCGCSGENIPVICSDVLDLVAEWRCFVRYGQLLDIRQYSGEWGHAPQLETIYEAIDSYTSAPAGYTLDFGLTTTGEMALIEVNDGFSIASYGLQHNLYAQLLSARWSELVGCEDPCDFGAALLERKDF